MKSFPQPGRSCNDTRLMLFLASALAPPSEAGAQRMQGAANAPPGAVPGRAVAARRAYRAPASESTTEPAVHIRRPDDTGEYRGSAMVGWNPLR